MKRPRPHLPIVAGELVEGSVYFFVTFVDEEMLVPVVHTVVFIGRNLRPMDAGQLYFQDVESHRKGIRHGDDRARVHAQFYAISESRMGPVLDYEHALDVLVSCSHRRRLRGLAASPSSLVEEPKGEGRDVERELERIWFSGARMDEELQEAVLLELDRAPLSFRFEDNQLQSALLQELNRSRVDHQLDDARAVVYTKASWLDVGDAINRVRDRQFAWYLVMVDTEEQAGSYRAILTKARLPFYVERHREKAVFLLRRDDRPQHDRLFGTGDKEDVAW